MSSGTRVVIVAFVLMQALVLTQADYSLAVTPVNSPDTAIPHKSDVCASCMLYQAGNHAACVYAILALAPHMPSGSLFGVSGARGLQEQVHGRLFATLINRISKTVFISDSRVLGSRVAQGQYIWAYIKEAIGPPSGLRPIAMEERDPNC